MTAIRKISVDLRSYGDWPIKGTRSIEPVLVIAPLASSSRLDSLRTASVGSRSPDGKAGRAHGVAVAGHWRPTIRRSETQRTTEDTG
jgi:hypothetical protein